MAASPNSGRKCGAAHGRIRGFADVGNVGLVAGLQSGAQVRPRAFEGAAARFDELSAFRSPLSGIALD